MEISILLVLTVLRGCRNGDLYLDYTRNECQPTVIIKNMLSFLLVTA